MLDFLFIVMNEEYVSLKYVWIEFLKVRLVILRRILVLRCDTIV